MRELWGAKLTSPQGETIAERRGKRKRSEYEILIRDLDSTVIYRILFCIDIYATLKSSDLYKI